jgi:hypothetical protein
MWTMSRSRLRPEPIVRASVATLASLAVLAAAACGGEQAFTPRNDGSAPGGTVGTAGRGGASGGTGNASGAGGTEMSGVAGSAGSAGTAGSGPGGTGAGGTTTGGGGAAGAGGMAGSGGAGGRPMGNKANGDACNNHDQCQSTWCVDGVCCMSQCAGACMTCNASASTKGQCVNAAEGTNPRGMCAVTSDVTKCGTLGCNGMGTCRYVPAGTECDSTPTCDTTSSSTVIPRKLCNGSGSCIPSGVVSCNGYRCTAGVCGTGCTDDSGCVVGGFCSASACVATANLAGNGDLETATTTGWTVANGTGTLALSSMAAGGYVHNGAYAISVSGRNREYQGPGYNLPTGPGRYRITAWGLQNGDPAGINGLLQIAVRCKGMMTEMNYLNVMDGSGFGIPMPENGWVMFSGTVDTGTAGADCNPNGVTPGLVRSAILYLNHVDNYCKDTPGSCPNLYLDDVIVNVEDGHNLVGNPNFEADAIDGWSGSAGSSTLAVNTTHAHAGTRSLRASGRTVPAAGPKWTLPTGAARYAISFWALHTGTQTHDLALHPTYTCVTPNSVVTPPAIFTATNVVGGTWVQLTGVATFPPAGATAGCKLAAAGVYVRQGDGTACGTGTGQVECPDIHIDDVSITIAP